jgi:hypothetical protein
VVLFVFRNIVEMVFVSHGLNSLLNLTLTLNILPNGLYKFYTCGGHRFCGHYD